MKTRRRRTRATQRITVKAAVLLHNQKEVLVVLGTVLLTPLRALCVEQPIHCALLNPNVCLHLVVGCMAKMVLVTKKTVSKTNGIVTWVPYLALPLLLPHGCCCFFSPLGTRPTVVTSLQHEQVTDVACGSFHTMVLTASGTIYGCGFGGALNSRLGLGVSEADQLTSANKVKTHSKFLVPTPVVNMPPRAIMMEEQEKSSLGGVSPRHLFFTGEEYDVEHAKHNGDDGGGDANELGEASLESLSMNDPNGTM